MLTYTELWGIQEPLLAMAGISQSYLHFSGHIKKWKNINSEWWYKLQLITWNDRYKVNEIFSGFFDAIYGNKYLSGRRLLSSIISSLFFACIFYWLFYEISNAFFSSSSIRYYIWISPWFKWLISSGEGVDKISLIAYLQLINDCIGINLIPDIISIAETRWVIQKASKRGSNLISLFMLDLFLTTAIWVITHLIAYMISTIVAEQTLPLTNLYNIHNPDWITFIATTYSTSFLWWTFISVVFFVSVMKRISNMAVRILESNWVSDLPIVLIVGVPCLICWPVLFIAKLMSN